MSKFVYLLATCRFVCTQVIYLAEKEIRYRYPLPQPRSHQSPNENFCEFMMFMSLFGSGVYMSLADFFYSYTRSNRTIAPRICM